MARTVSIGAQDFEQLIRNGCFYIDKTGLIKEWWESRDIVTLITRPRRFGKTLNLSMLEHFFSLQYQGQGDVFERLSIWKEEKYRKLQGAYPVISISFAGIKQDNFDAARRAISYIITELYAHHDYLRHSDVLTELDRKQWDKISIDMNEVDIAMSVYKLCDYLFRYYGRKVIILLDEYDTPMQEAYANGFWDDLVCLIRNLFNNTFKLNPYMERGVMTGITRVSKESLFSDLNNLKTITIASDKYAPFFGFTEAEVFAAMDEFHLENKDEVKHWYDGFTFGNLTDIYNPWSIINFLDERKLRPYWANTSSNHLASSLLRRGNKKIKMQLEELLRGRSILCQIDEEIVYDQLEYDENAVWSLLLASGYLKAVKIEDDGYELKLTNYEVERTFSRMVQTWFRKDSSDYNDFLSALLQGNLKIMNSYMNRIALKMFSFFDAGNHPSEQTNPERFYHGFVLGLLVDLSGRYVVTSNRESGFGRYDVMMEPLHRGDDGILLEFKVHDSEEEKDLEETARAALQQIEEKQYEQTLLDHGIEKGRIRKYGFAFQGKKVLILAADSELLRNNL